MMDAATNLFFSGKSELFLFLFFLFIYLCRRDSLNNNYQILMVAVELPFAATVLNAWGRLESILSPLSLSFSFVIFVDLVEREVR